MRKINKGAKYWVFSDTHFGHDKPFLYEKRGYKNIKEHNEGLVKNWNSVVNEDDIVFLLGDTLMGKNEESIEYYKQLKGHIYVIAGNHCTDNRLAMLEECSNTEHVEYNVCMPISYGKQKIIFSHYPMCTTNSDLDKPLGARTINISGHTHSDQEWQPNCDWSYNVCPEAHNNTPVLLEDILDKFREKIGRTAGENSARQES